MKNKQPGVAKNKIKSKSENVCPDKNINVPSFLNSQINLLIGITGYSVSKPKLGQ